MIQGLAVFVMLAILSVLIIVHECGHFFVARFFGFQTPVFGFGLPFFGPHWVIGRKWGTEFRVHALLLGGYVAIPELGDESNKEAFDMPLAPFRKFPIWQRALVAFAGVGCNIIFAYLIMLVMFLSMGEPSQSTVVYSLIKENPIAAQAGLEVNDQLVAINNFKVGSPDDAVHFMTGHKQELVTLHLRRAGKPVDLTMTTNADGKVGMGLVSKGPISYKPVEGNFFEVAGHAGVRLWNLTVGMLDALGQMVTGIFSGGKSSPGHPAVGIQDLHGVLAVIKIGADIAQQDWSQLFLFTIMISLDLAIVNLVPWPGLDGAHLAFMLVEGLRGKPMGERTQGELVKWGFISLLALMAVIMFNDVTALISGKLDFKKAKDEAHEVSKQKSGPADHVGDDLAAPTKESTPVSP